MAQNQSNVNQSTGVQQAQGGSPQRSRGNLMLILVVLAVVVILVLVVIAYLLLSSTGTSSTTTSSAATSVSSVSSVSSSGAPQITQTASQNSTPIEMSSSQAQALLKSGLSQYSGYDLFRPTSPTNITDLESVVPQLYGNATSGWVTYAAGSNATANATLEYVVITTSNAQQIASDLNNATLSDLPMTLQQENSGLVDGFSYSYTHYVNSTASFQSLSGYKNGHAVGLTINSYPVFAVNETALVDTVANVTP